MTEIMDLCSGKTAYVIVDMQKYYLYDFSPYRLYFNRIQPGCLDYLSERCSKIVIPNILKILKYCHEKDIPVLYLRLCGKAQDRSDLHRFFRETHEKGKKNGFDNVYPLKNDSMADIIDELEPANHDIIIDKTTFSAFTSSSILTVLKEINIETLIFSGLATSQCVETTARDASDHGFKVIHVEDTQADYDAVSHNSSLFSSQSVCGGMVFSTEQILSYNRDGEIFI